MIKYLDEIDRFISEKGIKKDNICIVGSAVFSIYGLRENNDIYFIILPSEMKRIKKNYKVKIGLCGYCSMDENIDIYKNRYYVLGITDDIIFNEKLFFYYKGYKVVLPEIELSYKYIKKRKKDLIINVLFISMIIIKIYFYLVI